MTEQDSTRQKPSGAEQRRTSLSQKNNLLQKTRVLALTRKVDILAEQMNELLSLVMVIHPELKLSGTLTLKEISRSIAEGVPEKR